MDLRIRTLRRAELDEVLSLAAEGAPGLHLERDDLERHLFEHDAISLAADVAGRVAGVTCGVTRLPEGAKDAADGAPRGFVKLLAVRESQRGQGVGSRLLSRIEERLATRGAREVLLDGAAPAYIQPGVPESLPSALVFFLRRRYRRVDTRTSLLAGLDDIDLDSRAERSRLEAAGVVLRRAVADDRTPLIGFVQRHFSPTWAEEVARSLALSSSVTHLALAGSEIAAFATAGLWARNAFGPMGTSPDWRDRGLGAILLRLCLEDLLERGERDVVVSWLGPERFYRKVLPSAEPLRYAVLVKTA